MWIPRKGQWVKFKSPVTIPGAHVLPDGYTVGIYFQPSGNGIKHASTIAKKSGKPVPVDVVQQSEPGIFVVDEAGFNLRRHEKGEDKGNWKFALKDVTDLKPVLDRSEIPAERLKNNPGWKPRA